MSEVERVAAEDQRLPIEELSTAHFIVAVPSFRTTELLNSLKYSYVGASTRMIRMGPNVAIIAERCAGRISDYMCPEESGSLVLKGGVHDTRTAKPADPSHILAAFLGETPDANRFEGEFAGVLYDASRGVIWGVNDQASLLHLYYIECGGATYITTAPLATARALGLNLNGAGVREFLGRGQVMCPLSVFAGMSRLGIGEHLCIRRRELRIGRHWSPYHPPRRYTDKRAAAEATAELLERVARRYSVGGPVVADLTGGYDSRLMVAALARAGAALSVTVNGHPAHPDVLIAHRVAKIAGWPVLHFGATLAGQITAAMRGEMTRMGRGELHAFSFYLHLLTRPRLARDHVMHVQGGGGELLRSFPWGQEFVGIGRRRPASVSRLINYRLLPASVLHDDIFISPYSARLAEDLASHMRTISNQGNDTLTTQQLDAMYLWRLTGHFGAYTSSLYDLLPAGVPLLQRTVIEHAVSLPWQMRLSAGLLRRTIALLHPGAATVETVYGATGGPWRISDIGRETRQLLRRVRHLINKVDTVALGGRVGKLVPIRSSEPAAAIVPFRTEEFVQFLAPEHMYSRGLYRQRALARLLANPDTPVEALFRIATIEQVCREIGKEPGPELLNE